MEKKEEKTPTNQHKKHPKPTTKKTPNRPGAATADQLTGREEQLIIYCPLKIHPEDTKCLIAADHHFFLLTDNKASIAAERKKEK